jgi:hypothetical protein
MSKANIDKAKLLEAKNAAQALLDLLSNDEPFLNGEIKFDVVSDESNPYKIQCLHVKITTRGITLETMENQKSDRQVNDFTWNELMTIIDKRQTLADLDEEINELNIKLRDRPATLKYQ